jgi:type IV pilus assembly protein PilC
VSQAFSYTARRANGAFVAGILEARSREDAFDALRMRSFSVTTLEPKESMSGALLSLVGGVHSCETHRIAFFRMLEVLVRSGVSMRRALRIVTRECKHAGFRELLTGLAVDIESGSSLSSAMRRCPLAFSPAACAIVRAGETSGTLDNALARVAAMLERGEILRKRTRASLAYPFVVVVVAAVLVAFLVAGVVPTITTLLGGAVSLPLETRLLMVVGRALASPRAWFVSGCAILVCAAALRKLWGIRAARAVMEQGILRLPVVGLVLRKSDTANCARTLGALLQSGVPATEAMVLTTAVARWQLHRQSLEGVANAVALGQTLAAGFAAGPWHSPLFISLVSAGEESATVGDMLLRVADYDDQEVDAAVTGLSALLEPILIIVLGGVVATIASAVLIPLYSIVGSIK